jgi:hypothetical protein
MRRSADEGGTGATGRSAACRMRAIQSVLVLTALSMWLPAPAQGVSGNVELHIKAAYLFNFGRYVFWPQQSGDVVIGIVGHDPIVDVLEKTIAGKTINGRAYRVKVFASADQIDHCDVLFLPRAGAQQAQSVMTAIAGKPILTVSDIENFSSQGGMVEFLLIDDMLKFDINLAAAEKNGLRISSELLRVAHQIKGKGR